MKNVNWKSLLPVLAAVTVFYVLSLAYFSPVLEGKRLVQGDKRNWQGMAQEMQEHEDAYGEQPLWTGSMFSGMPVYQIGVKWSNNLLRFADDLFHGFLPRPASFLFLYLVGMYILLRCLRVDPWLCVVGAIAYAFSSYFFVILEAGHNSKANAIGYMPAVLGALYLVYRGRVLVGAALLALFLGLEISMNHVQITYYLGIVLLLFVLAEAVRAFREGTIADMAKRSMIGLGAVVLALACNIGLLWTTYEYGRYTTRGKSELTINADGSAVEKNTGGLDPTYVTDWSEGRVESLSLLVPNIKGGATGAIGNQPDVLAKADPAYRQTLAQQNMYWGDQRFVSGPVYVGAVVVLLLLLMLVWTDVKARWHALGGVLLMVLLFAIDAPVLAGALVIAYLIAGLFLWKEPLPYALFGGLVLTLFLSWGRNYMPLTEFFLDHVPGYNKFRAVTIILVIVELAAPVLGILFLQRFLKAGGWDKQQERRALLVSGGLALALVVFAAAPSSLFPLLSDAERSSFNAQMESDPATADQVFAVGNALQELRATVLSADALRSLLFVVAGGILVFLFGRKKMGARPMIVGLGVLILIDLWAVDKRYVNNEKDRGRYVQWEDDRSAEQPYKPNQADMAILQQEYTPAMDADLQASVARLKEKRSDAKGRDKLVTEEDEVLLRFGVLRRNSHYRVLNLNNPFNDSRVSYFHKSVGGYHGAKLKRYQELIEFHLGPEMQDVIGRLQAGGATMQTVNDALADQGVINMLNTRYLIYSPDQAPIQNLNALGVGWFVDELRWVPDADTEITTLGEIDPSRTVIVDERFKDDLAGAEARPDPGATVRLDEYRADRITYTVNSTDGGIVVFSEIWYGPDWRAYVDGNEVPHVRADYVLRALAVPGGEHVVEFRMESHAYATSQPIGLVASSLVLLLVLGMGWMELRRARAAA